MTKSKPKTVHSVHVNLVFRGGLDTERYARELKALNDAATALKRIALDQATPEVGGQVSQTTDLPCELLLGGPRTDLPDCWQSPGDERVRGIR